MEILGFELTTWWLHWAWPILLTMVGLGLVIFFHELGHFLVAKWAGIKVEQFALGFWKRVVGFRRGETEYRINVIPFGGYVKMLGQDDLSVPPEDAQPDPRSWQGCPSGRKIAVLAAGVTMNVVFAAAAFVVVYTVGLRFVAPVVGNVAPNFPAAEAVLPPAVAEMMGPDKAVGLQPGDRITAIDGKPIRTFRSILSTVALSSEGEEFTLSVERRIGGEDVAFDTTLKTKVDHEAVGGRRPAFGVAWAEDTVIEKPSAVGYAGEERFRAGDRIVAVAGKEVSHAWEILPAVRGGLPDRPVEVTVLRDGERRTVPVRLAMRTPAGKNLLTILGMSARLAVAKVVPGSPAEKAGLREEDVIVDYAGAGPPTFLELRKHNEAGGERIPLRVLRDGKIVDLEVTPVKERGRWVIGLNPSPDTACVVAGVAEDSPAEKAGIVDGSVLLKVDQTPVHSWIEVYNALAERAGKTAAITFRIGPETKTADIGPLTRELFDPKEQYFYLPAIGVLEPLKTAPIRGNPLQALTWSVHDVFEWAVVSYRTLAGLVTRRVSTDSVAGPVGLAQVSVTVARQGVVDTLYFMAMLSVWLAVFNFLPLPILDGGHVLVTLIERFRGRALSRKFHTAWQISGLALIGMIFLALTFNDILRWVKGP